MQPSFDLAAVVSNSGMKRIMLPLPVEIPLRNNDAEKARLTTGTSDPEQGIGPQQNSVRSCACLFRSIRMYYVVYFVLP